MNKISFAFAIVMILGVFNIRAEVLDSTKVYPMDEVVVMASRVGSSLKNLPQRIEIIEAKDIKAVPNENLAEVIKRLTNLDIVQYPGAIATIGMRGFSPSAFTRGSTLLLINGKPSGTSNLATILMTNIDRIEVIKGPYATCYGSDAMGGVINLITNPVDKDFHGSVNLEGGFFGFYRADASVSGQIVKNLRGRFSMTTMKQTKDYRIGGSNLLKMSNLEKLILDKRSYGDTLANTKYDMNMASLGLEWDINSKWNARADGSFTFAKNIETSGNYWGSYGDSKKQLRRMNVYGTLERKGKHGIFSISPYMTRENEPNFSSNLNDGFVNFESEVSEYGFQMQQQHTFGSFKTVAGVDYGVYDYHSDRFNVDGTPTVPYKPDNRYVDEAVFLQSTYSQGRLDVNAGLRLDHFRYHTEKNDALGSQASDANYTTLNPSIGAQYRLLDNLKAHASFGTAFSVPDAYKTAGSYNVSIYFPEWDYTWVQSYVGNPDLKPEKSRTTDLGLSFYTPDRAFHSDLTYFHTNHVDQIVETNLDNGNISYINANSSLMNGLEFSADYDLGSLFSNKFSLKAYANWTWLFNADFTRTVASSTGADSTFTKFMLYVRKHNGNFGLDYSDYGGFSARINARYIGYRFEDDNYAMLRPEITSADYSLEGGHSVGDRALKYPDFLVLDLSVRKTFKNKFSVGLGVSNLLDENFTEKDGYPMPGRQIKLNLGYKF